MGKRQLSALLMASGQMDVSICMFVCGGMRRTAAAAGRVQSGVTLEVYRSVDFSPVARVRSCCLIVIAAPGEREHGLRDGILAIHVAEVQHAALAEGGDREGTQGGLVLR